MNRAPEPTYPRTEHCPACAASTTHVRQGCTRCMARADNRKQGLLFLLLGAPVLALGVGLFVWVPDAPPGAPRRGGWIWAAGGAIVVGGGLAWRGLRGVVLGRDPEV